MTVAKRRRFDYFWQCMEERWNRGCGGFVGYGGVWWLAWVREIVVVLMEGIWKKEKAIVFTHTHTHTHNYFTVFRFFISLSLFFFFWWKGGFSLCFMFSWCFFFIFIVISLFIVFIFQFDFFLKFLSHVCGIAANRPPSKKI
jgi:hypothetical protein